MLNERDLRLVRHAGRLAGTLAEDHDHTVVAAAYDEAGRLVTGINVSHFNGGPCAELVLLGQAAQHGVPVRLDTIVAVAVPGLPVLPPCGRCRQVLFDYHPGTRVIVHGRNGLEALGITELLPYPFDWRSYEPEAGGPRLYLHESYLDAVRAGDKRSTIRVHDPVSAGPVVLVFEHETAEPSTIPAEVTEIRATTVAALTEEDAHRDGFADRPALLDALSWHYPGINPATEVDIVLFELIVPFEITGQ